ncbi:MAG TPA: monofunctional biosynthetic peptidoglycan transglycosylase [Myxococcota bacterium]|nr:monofunctional biosynthetic peptidoglycan transglycosylase [Myxococcota bacterium]
MGWRGRGSRQRGPGTLLRRSLRILAWVAGGAVLGTVLLVLPWRFVAPPTSAFMLRDWVEHGRAPRYRWVPLSRISPQLAIAVVAAEDQRFPLHNGFDFRAIEKALGESRRQARGASTISQQVAKNLYLWPGRSFVRKALEAWLTVFIETLWPKRRILEVYLNTAEFGRGVFGASAASEGYLGKPASHLSLSEASLLAAALPSPKRSSVTQPSDYLWRRAGEIERAARGLGGSGYLARL